MRSQIIAMAGFICLATTSTAWAQEEDITEKKETFKAPKLVLGANLGLSANLSGGMGVAGPGFLNVGGQSNSGLFVRYYMGKHLALESGANFGLGRTRSSWYAYNTTPMRTVVGSTSFAVPVQLQYHLLSPESKLRPYFGIGVGVINRNFHIRQEETDGSTTRFNNSRTSTFTSFTQGLNWQLNKKWQINESITIQREHFGGNSLNADLRVGVGYSLFNKK